MKGWKGNKWKRLQINEETNVLRRSRRKEAEEKQKKA